MKSDATSLILDFMYMNSGITQAILQMLDEYLELNEEDKKSVANGVDGLDKIRDMLNNLKKDYVKRKKSKPKKLKKEGGSIGYV